MSISRTIGPYLPDLSSISGIIFYSFVTYIIIFTMSYCCTNLIEDKLDYETYVGERIKAKRVEKTK